MIRLILCLASLALAGCGGAAPAGNESAADAGAGAAPRRSFDPPVPTGLADTVRVRIETEAGAIVVALDHARAPVTTTNFVRYVDDRRFDGTRFYRVVRKRRTPGEGFIQGGIAHSSRLMLPPIRLEPTSETGLRHRDGTISMAHSTPGAAMGDFVILIGDHPSLDAKPGGKGSDQGYAAFGRVVEGLDVARQILAAPTVELRGRPSDRLAEPVRILRVRRAE
jgi:peptidyl-prolyl cis-trans isomerase A (cyclophilin A)